MLSELMEIVSKDIGKDVAKNNIDLDKKADMTQKSNNTDINAKDSEKNIESKDNIDLDKRADMTINSENTDINAKDSEKNIESKGDIDLDKRADMSLDTNNLDVDENNTFYDDNGVAYRNNDELLPNNSYEINGYTYKTDELGRIVEGGGTLHLKNDRPKLKIKDSMDVIGKGDQLETDDRGHLIADRFDGANGMENLIPQDAKLNKGEYKNLENQLATEVKSGKNVTLKVEPYYTGDSRRPDFIVTTYSIDDKMNMKMFENKLGD